MSDDAAFFRFGTNLDEVAVSMESALSRINAALERPLPALKVEKSADEFRGTGGVDAMVAELEAGKARVQKAFADLGNGLIDRPQFDQQFRSAIGQTVGNIPQLMAQTLGSMPDFAAKVLPAREMAQQFATDWVREMLRVARAEAANMGDVLGNTQGQFTRRQFEPLIRDVARQPVAYGSEGTQLAALRNMKIAESIVKTDLKLDKTGKTRDPDARDLEQRLGLEQLVAQVRDAQVRTRFDARGKEYQVFTPSDTDARLKAEESALNARIAEQRKQRAAELQAEAAAEDAAEKARIQALRDYTTRVLEPEARQMRQQTIAGEGFTRAGGGIVDAKGNPLTGSGAHANPLQAERIMTAYERQIEEARNAELIGRNLDRASKVDGFSSVRKLDDIYYEKTKDGFRNLTEEAQSSAAAHTRVLEIIQKEISAQEELTRQTRLANEATRVPGGLLDAQGRPYTTSGREANPLQASAITDNARRMQEEAANEARLAANYGRIEYIPGFSNVRKLDGRYYQDTAAGARELTAENLRLLDIMKKEVEVLRQQEALEIKTAEAAGVRANKEEIGRSGLVGGFLSRFHRGDSDFGTNLGQTIASAASFSLAYGSLFALQHAMRDTLSEFVDYQDSLTDLEVATRSADVVTGDWVYSLSQLSRTAGENVGAAMDTAARGVRAFTDASATPDQTRAAGLATEDAANKIALIANKSLPDATGDVISIGSAYDLQPGQFPEIVDAIANAKRNFGGDPTQVAQGLSLIAGAARSAGFELNDAANMISLVQSRTDESGQAISTRLARVFQIIQGSTGKNLAGELGLDPHQSPKQLLTEFAQLYNNPDTPQSVKDRITSQVGGTANLKEILPILKENDKLLAAMRDSFKNAGQGTDEFNRKSTNLVGTLKKLSGDISNIQVGLAKSGLFNFVGAGFGTIESAAHGVDRLLAYYDELPSSLRTVLGLLVDIAAVSKAVNIVSGKNGLFGTGGSSEQVARKAETTAIMTATEARVAAEERLNLAIAAAAERRVLLEGAAGAAGAAESAAVGAAGISGARGRGAVLLGGAEEGALAGTAASGVKAAEKTGLRGFLGRSGTLAGAGAIGTGLLADPAFWGIAAVVGGLAAYGKVNSDSETAQRGLDMAHDSYGLFNTGTSATELRAAAEAMNTVKGNLAKVPAGWSTKGDQLEVATTAARNRAVSLEQLARTAAVEERHANALRHVSAFGTGAIATMGDLANGLDNLSAVGLSALGQARAARKALLTPPPEDGSIGSIGNQQLTSQVYLGLGSVLKQAIKDAGGEVRVLPKNPTPIETMDEDTLRNLNPRARGYAERAQRDNVTDDPARAADAVTAAMGRDFVKNLRVAIAAARVAATRAEFTDEGPSFYQAAYAHNKDFAVPPASLPAPEVERSSLPALSPQLETAHLPGQLPDVEPAHLRFVAPEKPELPGAPQTPQIPNFSHGEPQPLTLPAEGPREPLSAQLPAPPVPHGEPQTAHVNLELPEMQPLTLPVELQPQPARLPAFETPEVQPATVPEPPREPQVAHLPAPELPPVVDRAPGVQPAALPVPPVEPQQAHITVELPDLQRPSLPAPPPEPQAAHITVDIPELERLSLPAQPLSPEPQRAQIPAFEAPPVQPAQIPLQTPEVQPATLPTTGPREPLFAQLPLDTPAVQPLTLPPVHAEPQPAHLEAPRQEPLPAHLPAPGVDPQSAHITPPPALVGDPSRPYQTLLRPQMERAFQKWVKENRVPFDPKADIVDYDMRGYFKDSGGAGWHPGMHFPDTFKTPYDTTFSRESKYATADNPFEWQGDRLVDDRNGALVFGKGLSRKSTKGLSEAQLEAVSRAAADQIPLDAFVKNGEQVREKAYELILGRLQKQNHAGGGKYGALLNGKTLQFGQVKAMLEGSDVDGKHTPSIPEIFQSALGAIPQDDNGTMAIAEMKAQKQFWERIGAKLEADGRNGRQAQIVSLYMRNATHAFRQASINRLDDMRQAEESTAKTNAELRAIRVKWAKREFIRAGDDKTLIEPLMESMDRQTIDAVEAYIKTARDAARAALVHAQNLVHQVTQAIAASMGDAVDGWAVVGATEHDPAFAALGKAKDNLDQLNSTLGAMNDVEGTTANIPDDKATLPSSGSGSTKKDKKSPRDRAREHADHVAAVAEANAAAQGGGQMAEARAALVSAKAHLDAEKKGTTAWFQALAQFHQAQWQMKEAVAGKTSAVADAHAAFMGGGIAAAHAAIVTARANLSAAAKGTAEYFQALGALYQAQWQMKEAVEAYHANLYLLRGDITDPVDQATAALKSAREKLRNARSKDDKAAGRVEVEQSEAALEKARWDQKLSDMQTAEQLGRVSYATYIRYLEHESDRMHKMHHKTRQQIDHMNEIDQALQEANKSAEGMFNMGDIDTRGLVYQVRRLVATRHVPTAPPVADVGRGPGSYQHVVNNHQQIFFNGTDIHMVRKVLREMLGSQAQRVTTSPRRGRG